MGVDLGELVVVSRVQLVCVCWPLSRHRGFPESEEGLDVLVGRQAQDRHGPGDGTDGVGARSLKEVGEVIVSSSVSTVSTASEQRFEEHLGTVPHLGERQHRLRYLLPSPFVHHPFPSLVDGGEEEGGVDAELGEGGYGVGYLEGSAGEGDPGGVGVEGEEG